MEYKYGLRNARVEFYEENPWAFYVFHCPSCKAIHVYPPLETTKYCGFCGHQFPPTLPVYDKQSDTV